MAKGKLNSESSWADDHIRKWTAETTRQERREWIEEARAQLSPEMRELMNLPDEEDGPLAQQFNTVFVMLSESPAVFCWLEDVLSPIHATTVGEAPIIGVCEDRAETAELAA